MSDLPPSRDFMLPPTSERCETCGKPRGDGPVWVVEHPRWEHAACRDWSRHKFPYDWQLQSLRQLAGALRISYALTVRAGVFLKGLRGRWPSGAREGLAELERQRTALNEALRKVRDKIERS